MSIETFQIRYAPQRSSAVFSGAQVNPLIEQLKTTLLAAGWTLDSEEIFPEGDLYIPGWYVTYAPFQFQNTSFINDNCGSCGYFGTSGGCGDHTGWFTGTIASLAASVSSCTDYVATPNAFGLHVKAKRKGTELNQPYLHTEIGVGLATTGGPYLDVAGGGYKLLSQSANGRTQFSVSITQQVTTGQILLNIHELAHGSSVQYTLYVGAAFGGLITPSYRIIANPYQFAIIDMVNAADQGPLFARGGNSIFATAPYSANPALNYGLVVIGPGQLMNATVWRSQPCSFAINAAFQTFAGLNEAIAGLALRCYPFSQPLETTNRKPIIQNAYLMAPASSTDEATIIGQVWDAFALSQSYAKGSGVGYDGHDFRLVSTQDSGVVSSLWLATS